MTMSISAKRSLPKANTDLYKLSFMFKIKYLLIEFLQLQLIIYLITGSFIVKTRVSRFGFRRIRSRDSGSSVSLGEYKSKPTRSNLTPRDPPIASTSLDGGKSRLPGLRFRKIFKKNR